MLRVFIRFSIVGDNSTLMTRVRLLLEDAGFVQIGASAYEHRGIPAAVLAHTMTQFWAAVANATLAAPDVPAGARFDHVWIYTGQVDDGKLVS